MVDNPIYFRYEERSWDGYCVLILQDYSCRMRTCPKYFNQLFDLFLEIKLILSLFLFFQISITNAQTYLSLLNILSTMTAMYGLMIQRKTFLPDLGKLYSLSGKILTVQTTLFSTIIPIIIINMLVSFGVISCGPMFPSKARGEGQSSYLRIYQVWWTMINKQLSCSMILDQWSMINDQWSMINDQWSMINDIWYMIYDLWSKIYNLLSKI